MKQTKVKAIGASILLAVLTLGLTALALSAAAAPPLPNSFYGTATLDTADIPPGTAVTAWINGMQYAETTSFMAEGQSSYRIHVPGDDPETAVVEGGVPGDTVTFQVDGFAAVETALWTTADHLRLDLTAFTDPLVPAFDFVPSQPFLDEDIQFDDLSVSARPIVAWQWDFGDGASSSQQNPLYVYPTAGTFSVTLTITDDTDLSDSTTQTVTVKAIPTADFLHSPIIPRVGETVVFTNTSTDPDGTIISTTWDFDDGSGSNLSDPTHVFNSEGIYLVTLTVIDSDGNSNFISQQIRVTGPLAADFSWTPDPAFVNQAVQFTDLSTDLAGTIISWAWDFDDGNSSTDQNPSHTYNNLVGLFIVTLTVGDDQGNGDSYSQEVLVTTASEAAFSYDPPNPRSNEAVQFVDETTHVDPTAVITGWLWDFGDLGSSSVQSPTHAYAIPGTFTVTLLVTDSHGLTDTTTMPVAIANPPLAEAGGAYTADEGQPILFDGSGSTHPDGTIVLYEWDLDGDGSYDEAIGVTTTQIFNDDADYDIGLQVTDGAGITGTDSAPLLVQNVDPAVEAGPDQTAVTGQIVSLPPATYSDPGLNDSHTMTLDWGDGDFEGDIVSGGIVTGIHVYTATGIFPVQLCVQDDDGGQGCDTFTTTVIGPPSVTAEKTANLLADNDGDSQPSPGDTLGYTITISNGGQATAENVVLTDTISPNTSLVPGSVMTSAGSLDNSSPLVVSFGDVAGGSSVTVTFAVTITNPFPAGETEVGNQGQIVGDNIPPTVTDDPNTLAPFDPTLTPVTAVPDLRLTKDDFQDSAESGQLIVYRITITNTGNQGASGILVTDTLPANTIFDAADFGGVESAPGVVTWPAFSLAGGSVHTYRTVVVRVVDVPPPDATTLVNTAEVHDDGSNGPDATPGNNSDTDINDLITGPDLLIPNVDDSSLTTDLQALTIAGPMSVQVANNGSTAVPDPFTVSIFEDSNADGLYTPAVDNLLGEQSGVSPLGTGSTVSLTISLAGTVEFAGNALYAYTDSAEVVAELDETNNYASTAADMCRYTPPISDFNPVVELSWPLEDVTIPNPTSVQSFSTPIIANLTDDNADGQINEADVPDVIFIAFSWTYSCGENSCGWYDGNYVMRAIKGDSGELIFTIPRSVLASGADFGRNSIAVGDIDGDGLVEIITADWPDWTSINRLYAFEHDGTPKWTSQTYRAHPAGRTTDRDNPSIADLDGDGTPEIIVGSTVFDNNGIRLWVGTEGRGWQSALNRAPGNIFSYLGGAATIAADLDLDGSLEVVAGNSAYNADGSVKWVVELDDGYPAVGNFDLDLFPEIVVVSKGTVRLHEHDGDLIWGPFNMPGSNPEAGGPPTIGDFDGDGMPEIGVAGSNRYAVYDTDGSLMWQTAAQDSSSGMTGSTVFDLDGDGRYEVIYRDEQYLRIYRGLDGAVLFQYPLSSATTNEMPVVADVDNDGNAEIIVSSDELRNRGGTWIRTNGIRVFGSGNDNWVFTRPIWNQNAYHVDNVNDDGSIPAEEGWSWLNHNSYRANAADDPFAAPDLTVSYIQADLANYPTAVTLSARIGNGGAAPVGVGSAVTFYDGDPMSGGTLITRTATTIPLLPGMYEDVSFEWNPPILGSRTIFVVVDDQERDNECRENNNSHSHYYQVPGLDLAVTKDNGDTRLEPSEVTTYTLVVSNIGTENSTGIILSDTLPLFTTFVGASGGGGAAAGVVTWPSFDLLIGESATRTVTVQLDNSFPAGFTTITNTAVASDDGTHGPDVTPDNHIALDVDQLDASPDLQVAKDDGRISVNPGETVTYTIDIFNAGSQGSSGIILSDTLPANTAFISASDGGITVGNTVVWPSFSLPSGEGASRTMTLVVSDTLPAGADVISNTVVAQDDGSSGEDGNVADNTAVDIDLINAAPDLRITKDDSIERVEPNDFVIYRILVENVGVQGASGVIVEDTLPAYGIFLGASHGATTIMSDTVVIWPALELAAGETAELAVTIQVSDSFPLTLEPFINTIVVSDDGDNGPDPTPNNNTFSDENNLDYVPDQIIPAMTGSGVNTNPQTLAMSGTVDLQIANVGNKSVEDPYQVTLFEDEDGDGQFGTGDEVLGQTTVSSPLSITEVISLSVPVVGTMQFNGNLIYGYVDSSDLIIELDETNNLYHTGYACNYVPPAQAFTPQIELDWPSGVTEPIEEPNSRESGETPMVVNLTDDNGDGFIDQNDVPEIVTITYGNSGVPFMVRAINSRDGSSVWNFQQYVEPGLGTIYFRELSAGDIDNDGLVEIVLSVTTSSPITNRLLALEHDGTFKWLSDAYRTHYIASRYTTRDHPAIADLDADGSPEIIVGGNAFDNQGNLLWHGSSGQALQSNGNNFNNNYGGAISIAVDLDLDGYLEVVTGKTAYRYDGSIYWDLALNDGFPAVGNFDDDPYPEIAITSRGQVRLHEHDGTIIWGPYSIPGTLAEAGGAPTVADFDGDGMAEVGTSGALRYVVYETDGTMKWNQSIIDTSSNMVGSTVFDLDGDGRFEAIHRDERYLRIFAGEDGTILYELRVTSSTQSENPVVADVDNDGNAEIVVTSDLGYQNPRTFGLFVIGDFGDNWVTARRIWNQQGYHVDNINEDGTIPTYEEWGWLSHNTYRSNVVLGGEIFYSPDLTMSAVSVDTANYPSSVTIQARVGNGGAETVAPGVPVSFYFDNPSITGTLSISTTATTVQLNPGDYEDMTLVWNNPPLHRGTVTAVIDDDGSGQGGVNECSEANNVSATDYGLPVLFAEAGPDELINEGSLVSFTGVYTDISPAVSHTITWNFGDGGEATGTLTPSHAYGDDGVYSVTLTVANEYGDVVADNLLVTVNNVAPAVDAGPDQAVDEGSLVLFSGAFSDPGYLDSHTILWDFGDGTAASETLSPTHVYGDNGSYTITLIVTDDDGGVGLDSLQVTVSNVAPVANAGEDQFVNEGDEVFFEGSISEAAANETYTITWDFGDGSGTTGILTPSHIYADNGFFTVSLTVMDNDGAASMDSLLVTVLNVAPAVQVGPDQIVDEGSLVSFSGTFTDPGLLDSHTYEWDFGNGITETGALSASFVYPDDGTFSVTLTVRDDDGGVGRADLLVAVENVAPIVDAGPDITVIPGTTVFFSGTFTDPGTLDSHSIAWDLGNGLTAFDTLVPTSTYEIEGDYTVLLGVQDDDGGVGFDSLVVSVGNVVPVVNAGPDATINEGDTFSGNGSFTDEGDGGWTATVDYDTGEGPIPLTLDPDGTFNLSHLYLQDGVYSVLVCVDDGEGIGCDERLVTVLNLPPVVEAGPGATITEGQSVTFAGSFTDPGVLDNHTLNWDFGDGGTAVSTLTPTHTYNNHGTYSANLTVTDEAGGEGQDIAIVTVLNVPPTVIMGPDDVIVEGDTYLGTGSFSDVGTGPWTGTADYGDGSGEQPLPLNSDQTFDLSHTYLDDGDYPVSVCINDGADATCADLTVTVHNMAPVVDAGSDQTVQLGVETVFNGAFTDAGLLDTHSIHWDFGDGDTAVNTLTPTHLYVGEGAYTVTLTVTDDDGGVGYDTAVVTVDERVPTSVGIDGFSGQDTTGLKWLWLFPLVGMLIILPFIRKRLMRRQN